MSSSLPPTMQALVHEKPAAPLTLQTVPTPTPHPGSLIVKPLAILIDPLMSKILSGENAMMTWPKPSIPAARVIGRVAATGPDTTSLEVGKLVMVEPFIRARDDWDVQVLWTGFDGPTGASKKFAGNWRDGALAEYVRVPLENCWALDEERLCGELGYSVPELVQLTLTAVGYGGLRGIDLKAGERIVVAPATGRYSGATVAAAVAMGASVVAVGRNREALDGLKATFPEQVKIVQLTGDVEKDTAAMMQFGTVDAFLDMSPPHATESTHTRAGINAVRLYGRVSLMGGLSMDIPGAYFMAVLKNLTIRGQYMYERADVRSLIKLAESGALKLGKKGGSRVAGEFEKLENFEKAMKCASAALGVGNVVTLKP